MNQSATRSSTEEINAFISRWTAREGGAERANYQMFLTELCSLIGVVHPEPAGSNTEFNDYVFERHVKFKIPDGTTLDGRIDLYKRGAFVLEAKQSRQRGGKKYIGDGTKETDLFGNKVREKQGKRTADRAWDVMMLNARRQAEDYAKALPTEHGWPPFLLVCDVGHCIEVFADFSGQGKNYAQFPDRNGFRIFLEDLHNAEVRDRLEQIWTNPHSLDPTRKAAKVTREIAERLAEVTKSLEKRNYPAEDVALFLMRCLFTMFAEDVKLLPENSFTGLLATCEQNPKALLPLLTELWNVMDKGGFSTSIQQDVRVFNGNLFANAKVIPLNREEIGELKAAAKKDWREVEPAIFGALLEQALDPQERQRLGAHYTPRAYVERLVVATIMEPLRTDWAQVLATAERLKAEKGNEAAAKVVRQFQETLCSTRVLDPACGTGNFLYVSLELMKRLEGEVIEALLDLGGQEALIGLEGHTIDPHQFLGLELNPRAAAIAELVLWLGYLQWHLRTKAGMPAEPILRAFKNINSGKVSQGFDAVLTHDGFEVELDANGRPKTRKSAQGGDVEIGHFKNPRRPQWPAAEYIVGNPPFMGGKDIRSRLGDAYAKALWDAHKHINDSADFVMYWWDRAAEILTAKGTVLKRFGLVTTNSITQEFSRRVIKARMEKKPFVSLLMAIPDHPWTKVTSDAAAVRIAMTVGGKGRVEGALREATQEEALDTDTPMIVFSEKRGSINGDLTIGADVTKAQPLKANEGLCSPGVKLHGAGFIVTPAEARHLGLGRREDLDQHIRPYRNGRDLTAIPRNVLVIDLFGLEPENVRKRFPEVYQHILDKVKPERDVNNRATYRDNWWVFGEPRSDLRPALKGLSRYIATTETSKHRMFSSGTPR
ncbi:MAG: class I SAM-dependent DNA methyltransferase [Alphaproteobacteria bacterium]